ncbi:glycosyltransferase [Xenococcus sp. PCC 7305]|uniref:glycosyltransferase n=1 Tax=Xenococcus sp. PCC 7305 TaxID=102125 RepID=UPI0002ACBF2A|nr:glycosyltransferase [Xenococcus sp. PCC 7305]ELS03148.1 glycosyltransferase [Xenococcus sp. PCC 7305]
MTSTQQNFLHKIKESLGVLPSNKVLGEDNQYHQLLRQIQLELTEQKELLLKSQNELKKEQTRNDELTHKLGKAEETIQSLSLKRVPSMEVISQNHYPSMADDLINTACPQQSLKICLVTQDIFGPIRNGGIGTAFYQLANWLAQCDHQVTILYSLGSVCENETIDYWINYYAEKQITFVPVSNVEIPSAPGSMSRAMLTARKVYEYLKKQNFNIIHASDWKGNCFYALLAKKLGIAFANTTFCIRPDSPSLWNTTGNNHFVTDPNHLITSYIERKSVEWADIVYSPSLHLLNWMEYHGYNLPKHKCYVQPYVFPVSNENAEKQRKITRLDKVDEIVFFGRLEPRKGIQVFCKALTMLSERKELKCKVVFMGKVLKETFDTKAYIESHAKNWSFEWEIISEYNSIEARNYLKKKNRLAVIASLLDNSPLVVYECLSDRIPFLCSDRGGTPELIHEEDKDSIVFPIHPGRLADLFERVLETGVVVARPKFDFQENLDIYAKWHLAIGNNPNIRIENSNSVKIIPSVKIEQTKTNPLVSICLAHINRPKELSQAVSSIRKQTYGNYEVILVDDGSNKPEAIAYLDSLEKEFTARNWQIIRQENLYTGVVRNTAAKHAKGEYLLFMDDDNCAKSHEIETFVSAAQYSGADVLTCFCDAFEGEDEPHQDSLKFRITPVGDCVSHGLLSHLVSNCFGDTNALVKKEFFDKIGGFTEDYGVGLEDKEFFARAVLRGGKLLVIPEALYWYRLSKERVRNKHFSLNAGSWRVFRPYMDNLPAVTHDFMRLAMGLFDYYNSSKGTINTLKKLSSKMEEDFTLLKNIHSK